MKFPGEDLSCDSGLVEIFDQGMTAMGFILCLQAGAGHIILRKEVENKRILGGGGFDMGIEPMDSLSTTDSENLSTAAPKQQRLNLELAIQDRTDSHVNEAILAQDSSLLMQPLVTLKECTLGLGISHFAPHLSGSLETIASSAQRVNINVVDFEMDPTFKTVEVTNVSVSYRLASSQGNSNHRHPPANFVISFAIAE